MSPLNWGDTKKAIDESKRNSRRTRRFQIKDGESVSLRFLGDDKEPFIYKRHYDNRNSRYLVCAEDAVVNGKHKGCVPCYEAKKQGKNGQVRLSTRVFAFTVYDPRKFHFIETNPEKEKFQNCKDDPTCRWCRKGIEQKVNGVCHWSLAGQVAEQLQVFERDLLGKKCAVCQLGTIKVTMYVCPECDTELDVDDPFEERRCFECGTNTKIVMVKPKEIVVCSKGCAKARRTTLSDAFVVVTRSGESTNTTYNFSPGDIGPKPKEWKDAVGLDFSKDPEFQPLTANEQAAVLGTSNPFRDDGKEKKGSTTDDDDDGIPFKKASDDDDDAPDADTPIFRR